MEEWRADKIYLFLYTLNLYSTTEVMLVHITDRGDP